MSRYDYLGSELQGRDPRDETLVDLLCSLTKGEWACILAFVAIVMLTGAIQAGMQ